MSSPTPTSTLEIYIKVCEQIFQLFSFSTTSGDDKQHDTNHTGQRFIEAQANHRSQYAENLLQPYRINENANGNNNNNHNFFPPQLQQNIPRPITTKTTTRPIPLWSSAPIVVDYEDEYVLQQQQQKHPQNAPLRPTSNVPQTYTYYPTPTSNDYDAQSRALLQSFPGEFNARRTFKAFPASTFNQQQSQQHQQQQIPNYYYRPYQQQQQHFSPAGHETPYPFAPASAPAPASTTQTLNWPAPIQQDRGRDDRELERERARVYAAHFEHYVRKYPHRLQPIYEPLVDYKK